jgi:hypothetical protein
MEHQADLLALKKNQLEISTAFDSPLECQLGIFIS